MAFIHAKAWTERKFCRWFSSWTTDLTHKLRVSINLYNRNGSSQMTYFAFSYYFEVLWKKNAIDKNQASWVTPIKLYLWGRNLVLSKSNQSELVEISLKTMKDRDFTKKLSKNPEKKVHNSRSYKIFGKYQSEGEERQDRAQKNQLLLFFI